MCLCVFLLAGMADRERKRGGRVDRNCVNLVGRSRFQTKQGKTQQLTVNVVANRNYVFGSFNRLHENDRVVRRDEMTSYVNQ